MIENNSSLNNYPAIDKKPSTLHGTQSNFHKTKSNLQYGGMSPN